MAMTTLNTVTAKRGNANIDGTKAANASLLQARIQNLDKSFPRTQSIALSTDGTRPFTPTWQHNIDRHHARHRHLRGRESQRIRDRFLYMNGS